MERVKIETTQNVLIEHDLANVGDRILAGLLDFLFMFAYFLFMLIILGFVSQVSHGDEVYVAYLILQLPLLFYSLAFEIILHGQTPGKKILKIKVVKLDGSAPSLGSYLIRWILRLVDIWLFSGVVAIVTVISNGKGQRLGDIAAGTSVIKNKKKTFFKHSIYKYLPQNYELNFPEVEKLSEADINTINKVIIAYTKNRNKNVTQLLFDTAKEVKKKTGIETNLPPKIFLNTIIKDYNFINRK